MTVDREHVRGRRVLVAGASGFVGSRLCPALEAAGHDIAAMTRRPVEETVGRDFDVGGPEILDYIDMMRRVAVIQGRRLRIVPVPLLTARASSRWLSLVTDVDVATGRTLIDSVGNEVVVRDPSIRELIDFELTDYTDAVLSALGERARHVTGDEQRTR